jgi:biopolymer transport protein ExbD
MAELVSSPKSKSNNCRTKTNKKIVRIDLTPMVDLGFLLITFFIFTTTMSQAKALDLALPKGDEPSMNVKLSGALTIYLTANNQLYYCEDSLASNGNNLVSATFNSIRQVIITKKRITKEKDLFLIIKPTDACSYQNIIDILDEVNINMINRYAMDNVNETENAILHKALKNQ